MITSYQLLQYPFYLVQMQVLQLKFKKILSLCSASTWLFETRAMEHAKQMHLHGMFG